MRTAKIAKVAGCLAVLVGGALGMTGQEARANPDPAGVYLWKDLLGKCPTTCDRNQYECPCKSS
jgi:hypothetical protein